MIANPVTTSSQEDFFDELVDIDKSIATAKGRYEFVEAAINKMQSDEGEKENTNP